jgi:2-oxoglutarate dehydrogenase E2 component (dihydrolipoamide succinyltransferase)
MPDITMPQLGETVTEGTITKWFKEVGDTVAEDEVLFEVSTDKVDSEVPSPAAGVLQEIKVPEGETVEVGAVIAVVGDGAAAPAADQAPAQQEAPVEPGEAGTGEADEPAVDDAPAAAQTESPPEEPEVRSEPAGGDDPSSAAETPSGPAAGPADYAPPPAAAAGGERDAAAPGSGRLLSPVVRRLIAEHDLDPATIKGTGAGGRITRSDVLAVIEGGGARPAPAEAEAAQRTKELAAEDAPAARGEPLQPDDGAVQREQEEAAARGKAPEPAAAAPAAAPAPAPAPRPAPAPVPTGRVERVPFTNIRRRTAEHMVRSKATSAHTLMVIEVDYAAVDRARQPARAAFKEEEGVSLTYLPFVSRAVIDAIREYPRVNASVGDDELLVHHDVNLAIAVDLDLEGLVAPVVQGADGKRLRALAREIADLASRARERRLGPDDIAGGTFTITNPGPFGTLLTGAIINQPQVAILSTDGVKKRPVAIELPDGSDGIAVHPTGLLAINFDHRAIDGAYAAAFLAKVKEIVETRDWEAEIG